MPASFLVELLVELVGELLGGLVLGGVEVAREKRQVARELRRARALAMADVWVLAAHFDYRVTEAERVELARRLPRIFKRLDVEATADELLERWTDRRAPLRSDEAVVETVRDLTRELPESDRRRAFDGVVALARCEGDTPVDEGAYRTAESPRQSPASIVRLFGRGLAIEADRIEEALERLRQP